ncbi:ATP-binding protein [Streptomyces himalayensis]|uniref:ATP-binding protein n=1 Tax=Streptomyces himalayensis subsp. himalayensis TaxID=2756131 RepID=A0A7W0IBS0_9ACTN|nr:ATP-binding protein [Streptomyces himalayensis]MBA2949728.1 ATP-binding protein [Streptomyces himalayensis subsp. himalayensis]
MSGYEVAEPRLRCVLPFEAEPAEVQLLRQAVTAQLSQWGMAAATDETQLVVTELVTNVIKHVGQGAAATLILESRGQRLRVEVHDKSHVVPSVATLDCDEGGWGLHLFAALAVDWGTVVTALGKAVWCEIPLDPPSGCRRIERAVTALEIYQGMRGRAGLLSGRRGVEVEESAVELIVDLLHWTTAWGCDPDDVLDRAQIHYEAEAGVA